MFKNAPMILSDEEPVRTLIQFLDGKLALDGLLDKLSEYLVVEFPSMEGSRKILRNDLEGVVSLEFKPLHIANMIKRYLDGQVSDQELSDWSAFIYLSGLFIPEGVTEEERWKAGEGPAWDILQQFVSPSVFGTLNPLKAEEFLQILGEM